MNNAPLFAEVILPLALKGTYTYLVPRESTELAGPGMRVLVPLGKNKIYTGIIQDIHREAPTGFEPKTILSFPDNKVLVHQTQLQFWEWIANYYLCSIGEVMHAALPSGLKLASESVFRIIPSYESTGKLSDEEMEMLEFLKTEDFHKLEDLLKGPFGPASIRLTKSLVEKGAASMGQQLKKGYQPRKVTRIRLHPEYEEERLFVELLEKLSRAPAQVKALERFAELSRQFDPDAEDQPVDRNKLTASGIPSHAVNGLLKKGVFEKFEMTISRIHPSIIQKSREPYPLTTKQNTALEQVKDALQHHPATLLEGITSSGKTEIYIHLIKEQLEKGNQVLYLLPEIALTTQIIHRLIEVFGNRIGVYHSKYSDNERVEIYRNLSGQSDEEPYSIILGVRSALFLPFTKLGLIIVDEEHEYTYKQIDPAPRYHARDAVTILGLFTGAQVLFGSATPSFETLYNVQLGKYGHVTIDERYGKVSLPEIVFADTKQARKRKQLRSHFTPELLQALQNTIDAGKQAILFQNRRGFSTYILCNDCGDILKCTQCDVSLTYHRYDQVMVCHYCGYKTSLPRQCPECNSAQYHLRGFGTEKIEDDLKELFPEIVVGRLDLDKAKSKKAYERLFNDFENGRMHVLVGTQMVTKGLDFSNVDLVGILDADSMLNFPDFRAFERSFQLMLQVSGRAGRRDGKGKVVIQTTDPSHPVLKSVLTGSPGDFYMHQIEERRLFKYPPVTRMITITLRHEIPSILDGGSVFIANELKDVFGRRVLGPQAPVVGRTHGKYIKQIILKIEREASVDKAKKLLGSIIEIFSSNPVYRQIRIVVDVDPV